MGRITKNKPVKKNDIFHRCLKIIEDCQKLKITDARSSEDIIGYDEYGLAV